MTLPTTRKIRRKRVMYTRQKGCCCYCEQPFPIEKMTWEHLIPKSRGGGGLSNNKVLSCAKHNSRRPSYIHWMFWKSYILGEISLREMRRMNHEVLTDGVARQ